jgi:hypothetical protein
MILVVCVLGILSVFGAILYFGDAGEQGGDDATRRGPGQGGEQGATAFHLGGPFFNQLFERHPDASQPVTGVGTPTARSGAGSVSTSSAGGGGGPIVIAPQAAPPPQVCAGGGGGVLGALLGLLGGLLGGGGGGC